MTNVFSQVNLGVFAAIKVFTTQAHSFYLFLLSVMSDLSIAIIILPCLFLVSRRGMNGKSEPSADNIQNPHSKISTARKLFILGEENNP